MLELNIPQDDHHDDEDDDSLLMVDLFFFRRNSERKKKQLYGLGLRRLLTHKWAGPFFLMSRESTTSRGLRIFFLLLLVPHTRKRDKEGEAKIGGDRRAEVRGEGR